MWDCISAAWVSSIGLAMRPPKRVVLAVTSAQSLILMEGFPEYLADLGWDVHIVCDGAESQNASPGLTYHSLTMRREPSPIRDLISLIAWALLLVRLRPSLVVAGTPKAGLLGIVAAFIARVPTRIYMLRGFRPATETGFKRRILMASERVSAHLSTKVLAVSSSLKAEFLAEGLAAENDVVVLGAGSSNGVDVEPGYMTKIRAGETAALTREDVGLDPLVPVVGFVGRLARDKGLSTLLAAAQEIVGNGTEMQLLLVGPEEHPRMLDQLRAAALASEVRVQWTGPVREPQLYYPMMDLLCLPSHREGFPNVVLEAAVSGAPTIASDVTGCVDAVVDGETGLLFERENSRDLASKLSSLLDDPARRKAFGIQARERAISLFDRRIVWRLTEEFFDQEVARNRRREGE